MHTRIQIDPTATITFREGSDGAIEMVIFPAGDCDNASAVIEMSRAHYYEITGQ